MSRIDAALRDIRSLEALAARRTALSVLDPRAKILATLGFIVAVVSFDRYVIAALLPFAVFVLVQAGLGEIPLRIIARKVLLASPLALMIGLFNPLLDPAPVMTLLGQPIGGGWVSLASLLIRFGLTAGAALVLLASTGFQPVCVGLSRLGVPHVFTTQLLFLHRYALLLAAQAGRMSLARELRAGHGAALPLAVYASLLGHLLLRAMERAQRIHQAMISRGFDGELRASQTLRWRAADSLFLVVCWTCFALLRQFDPAHFLGRLLIGRVG